MNGIIISGTALNIWHISPQQENSAVNSRITSRYQKNVVILRKAKGRRMADLQLLQAKRKSIMRFPSASEPDGRDTYRSSDRYGADGAVRRNSCLQRRSQPSARRQSGAYRAWTGSFFSSVQPFLL